MPQTDTAQAAKATVDVVEAAESNDENTNDDADHDSDFEHVDVDETTIAELAALVVELTGTASGIEYGPLPEDDPLRRMPDIGLAERSLGWSPNVALRDGLVRTIAWFRASQARSAAA